jgi:hypothetical protein
MDDPQEAMTKRVLRQMRKGTITFTEAVELLVNEMSRRHPALMLDEHLYSLTEPLKDKGYTVGNVPPELDDDEIKRYYLTGQIYITKNGDHFKNIEDRTRRHYGLIWVRTTAPDIILVEKIEEAMMTHNFKKNLLQFVQIQDEDRTARGRRR